MIFITKWGNFLSKKDLAKGNEIKETSQLGASYHPNGGNQNRAQKLTTPIENTSKRTGGQKKNRTSPRGPNQVLKNCEKDPSRSKKLLDQLLTPLHTMYLNKSLKEAKRKKDHKIPRKERMASVSLENFWNNS